MSSVSTSFPQRQSTQINKTPLFTCCSLHPLPLLAVAGGGGSSKTGIQNTINLETAKFTSPTDVTTVHEIPTGELICTALAVAALSDDHVLLAAATAATCDIYVVSRSSKAVSCTSVASFKCCDDEQGINSMCFSSDSSLLVLGSERGDVAIFKLTALPTTPSSPAPLTVTSIATVPGAHSKAPVCAVCFISPSQFDTGGKDGFLRLWDVQNDALASPPTGSSSHQITIPPPKPVPGARPENARQKELNKQVMVRCLSYNPSTNIIYTVSSGRRGGSYLHKWSPTSPASLSTTCVNNEYPSSSLTSIAREDAKHSTYTVLCVGGVDGSVRSFIDFHKDKGEVLAFTGDPLEPGRGLGLFGVRGAGVVECHDLPITAICRGSGEGVDVVSVSADAKTVRIKVYGKTVAAGNPLASWLFVFLVILVAMYLKVVSESYCGGSTLSLKTHVACVGRVVKSIVGGEMGLLEPLRSVVQNKVI